MRFHKTMYSCSQSQKIIASVQKACQGANTIIFFLFYTYLLVESLTQGRLIRVSQAELAQPEKSLLSLQSMQPGAQ
jgi:hypothetical protein